MENIKHYFDAEKSGSIIFILAGLCALLTSIWFWVKFSDDFYKGMAYPLAIVAVVQLIAATTIFFRTPNDIIRAESYITSDKSKIKDVEIPRMEKVMKNFAANKYILMALMMAGLILWVMKTPSPLIRGISAGIFIQASLILFFDYFAERRAEEYLAFLYELAKKI